MTNLTKYSEDELMIQIAKGNEEAFRQMFQVYHNKLYNYLLKFTHAKETAEDTVHDVFLKIWTNREKLSEVQNLNSYLYRMCHNHAINALRRMATQTIVVAAIESRPVSAAPDAEDKLISKEVRQLIHNAINSLTPQQKAVFKMSREQGLKQEEIAKQMNISVFTVKKHLTNALNQLRELLAKHYGPQAVALFIIHSLIY